MHQYQWARYPLESLLVNWQGHLLLGHGRVLRSTQCTKSITWVTQSENCNAFEIFKIRIIMLLSMLELVVVISIPG